MPTSAASVATSVRDGCVAGADLLEAAVQRERHHERDQRLLVVQALREVDDGQHAQHHDGGAGGGPAAAQDAEREPQRHDPADHADGMRGRLGGSGLEGLQERLAAGCVGGQRRGERHDAGKRRRERGKPPGHA